MSANIGKGSGLEQFAGFEERMVNIKEGERVLVCRSSKKGKERVETKDNLVFDNRHLSKLHASLVKKNGVLYLRDEKSTFGTLLNGQYLRRNEFYKVSPLDVIGFIISKPSKEIRRVVDENSELAMIPLKTFGTPKVALKLSYRVEGDSYIFSVASWNDCPYEDSCRLGLTLYKPLEQVLENEDDFGSENQLGYNKKKQDLSESDQVEFEVDTSQCHSKSTANEEEDGDYSSDLKNLSYKGWRPEFNLHSDFGWDSGFVFDSEDSIEPDEDYTSSQMDSAESGSLYLSDSRATSTTSFDGSTENSSKEIIDSEEEEAFGGDDCCSVDRWLNPDTLKSSNSRKRKFSDYVNDLLSDEEEVCVAGDRTNKKAKLDSERTSVTTFAKELAKGTFYVVATLTAIGVYGGYLEKYAT